MVRVKRESRRERYVFFFNSGDDIIVNGALCVILGIKHARMENF